MLKFEGKKILLACGPTDGRRSINGLVAMVTHSFPLSPYDAAVFVFCNKNRDRLKILEFDGDGFWLHLKRIEKSHFKWPAVEDGMSKQTMALTNEELTYLIGGTQLELKLRRQELQAPAVY
jgi:transposase